MNIDSVYSIGKRFRIPISIKKVDEKLKFTLFPYDSAEIISTCIIVFFVIAISGYLLNLLARIDLIVFISYFFAALMVVILYIYPVNVYYTHTLMRYQEEMLRAIMRISTFILMKSNLEYSI